MNRDLRRIHGVSGGSTAQFW